MKREPIVLAVVLLGICGCRNPEAAIVLYNMRGEQRVWPYVVDQPMVVAFWNTSSVQCIEDLPGLNTLERRDTGVHLMSVCTGERLKASRWMRKENVRFEVVHDPRKRLARRLGVHRYPTYLLFDYRGREIARSHTIRTIHNWFDKPRWLRRASRHYVEPEPRKPSEPAGKS